MGFMQKGSILRYYTFDSNAVLKKLDWQYSATAMEKDLHERFCGQLIQAIYIEAAEFSEGLHHHGQYLRHERRLSR